MLRFVITLYFIVLSFFSLFCIAPKPKYTPQFIAKLHTSASPQELNEITAFNFLNFKPLNIEQTLYSITYNPNLFNENEALNLLQKQSIFQIIQKNHQISLRNTIPNDTFFSRQWHLGLIHASEAWNIHRSSTNRRGDTIIIAVIDDGLHFNHPDFKGNIWINYADTANNGIDDDGNGYIDDHYGWNFYKNNNDISDSTFWEGEHGTAVAGIIGAKTNNKIGISGIMWNVKLMVVNIADSGGKIKESDVINAYSYVLQQRKLYNSTNGKKGAFIVGTNSSWGNDNQFPQDAPIWCSFYDSLGKQGILNASAAANTNFNIDINGDLPSLCTSKHLIVVGSTTRYDNFGGCGYSDSSIDISAPGQSVFTSNNYVKSNIDNNNLYDDSHTGTSFSTPMVTAAIGVLHGYACERVLDSIKKNPAGANLLLRKFILESVDEIPALAGKNATSGRLNIKKAMQKMDGFCYNLSIGNFNNTAAISIYPNPGNGEMIIKTMDEILSIKCFDITGKQINYTFNDKTLKLNASNGVYFISIQTKNNNIKLKYVLY